MKKGWTLMILRLDLIGLKISSLATNFCDEDISHHLFKFWP
ncbi:MAG: hypothetical protein ACD_12C00673G0003 [uncultured bacterium]|nr:MAG: hypothetical protein ACD_12C00673G0003 [uncultured bacterium]